MSVRLLASKQAPILLRSLQRRGVFPDPLNGRATRHLGERPKDAAYRENVTGVHRPEHTLTAPSLRPSGPIADAYARQIDEAGERFDVDLPYGYLDVPDVRIWPAFGVHWSRSGNFVDVYCGDWTLTNPKYELPRLALPLLSVDGRPSAGIFLAPAWYHNFYHWMIDILPRLDLVGAALAEGLPIVVPAQLPESYRGALGLALAAAGHPDAEVLALPGRVYKFARLVMPTALAKCMDVSRRQHDFLRRMMLPVAEDPGGRRRIYVSRRDAASRRIGNESEIEDVLASRGFETVVMSQLSPAAQAGLFHAAEAVVAPHGAGLANLAFSQPGTVAIEIFQAGHFAPYFARLAQLSDLTYGFGVSEAVGTDGVLDPKQLIDLLDRAGL